MKFIFRPSLKAFQVLTFTSLIVLGGLYFLFLHDRYQTEVNNLRQVVTYKDSIISDYSGSKYIKYPFATNYERKDWHDWKFIEFEKSRTGPGKTFEVI